MSMLMSAVFATAKIVRYGKMSSIGRPGAPAATTSSSGVSDVASSPTGTTATATTETSTYTKAVMLRPVMRILGKIDGSFVSSTMLTESSKPTSAKKPSAVAPVIARKTLLSPSVSKMTAREKSASPWKTAMKPTTRTRSRPVSSTHVRNTLNQTPSLTPRRLIAARMRRKTSAMMSGAHRPGSKPSPLSRLAATARAAVVADVMPEHRTANATRNVTKWMPNALWA